MAPKEKRRNSEKRKEKSRDAARSRRSKESEIFTDMANLLPLPMSVSSQLDKASVMRLAIAYLKTRSLMQCDPAPVSGASEEEQLETMGQALGGVLMALTPDGDVAYLSENISRFLGLSQIDVMGQSIYDYCHPCDHDELRESLALPKDPSRLAQDRSVFLRFKSTLSSKSRSGHNLKSASYKVMKCTGRVLMANKDRASSSAASFCLDEVPLFDTTDLQDLEEWAEVGEEEEEEGAEEGAEERRIVSPVTESNAPTHFLVLVLEPIPHPANIDGPMDARTFVTKHSLDMTYTNVDDKIEEFLGYVAGELEGRSAYDMHHALDHEAISKCYKTLFTMGQVETGPYRFLARRGGYAWVVTQASLIYGAGRDSGKAQSVVCIHTCLSEVEEEESILCASQAAAVASGSNAESNALLPSQMSDLAGLGKPSLETMTSKLFQPRTAEMKRGFLIFTNDNDDDDDQKTSTTVCKEEEAEDDLTHLAPIAGDSCIPLDVPSVAFPTDFDLDLLALDEGCFPLADLEVLPPPSLSTSPVLQFNLLEEEDCPLPLVVKEEVMMDDLTSLVSSEQCSPPGSSEGEEEELERLAPYIPMNVSDDLPIFDSTELFRGLDLDALALPVLDELNETTEQLTKSSRKRSVGSVPEEPLVMCHGGPTSPKRLRGNNCNAMAHASSPPWTIDGRMASLPSSPPKPSRLIELLLDDKVPLNGPRNNRPLRKSSVLENLLVSGRDLSTGHRLKPSSPPSVVVTKSSSSSSLQFLLLTNTNPNSASCKDSSTCEPHRQDYSYNLMEDFDLFPDLRQKDFIMG